MAPGSRLNAIVDTPATGNGNFQINVDGQQVTQEIAGGGFGSPGYSKEAIAELESTGPYRYIDAGPAGTLATFLKYLLPKTSKSTAHAILSPFGSEQKSMEALAK